MHQGINTCTHTGRYMHFTRRWIVTMPKSLMTVWSAMKRGLQNGYQPC